MMREVIDRFRYRFELWRREQREDLGIGGDGSPESAPPRVTRAAALFVWLLLLAVPIAYFVYIGSHWESRGYVTPKTITFGLFLSAPVLFALYVALVPDRRSSRDRKKDE